MVVKLLILHVAAYTANLCVRAYASPPLRSKVTLGQRGCGAAVLLQEQIGSSIELLRNSCKISCLVVFQ